MIPSYSTGVIFALIATLSWGISDFGGGFAARRHSQYQVLLLVAASGLTALLLLSFVFRESMPLPSDILKAAMAGILGGMGIAAFYRGLSLGNMAFVSPTASVIGVAIPVIYELLLRNLPTPQQLAGFILAGLGIWLVAQKPETTKAQNRPEYLLALIAGLGFGGFFIFIGQVSTISLFAPLVISKTATLLLALASIALRKESIPAIRGNPIAVVSGFLDVLGNIMFLIATRFTRLDIAAVLSSFYSPITVLLAWIFTHERIGRKQWLGVLVCLLSVALIL